MTLRQTIAVALVSLALGAAACSRTPSWQSSLVYRLEMPGAASPTARQVDETVGVLRRRLGDLGDVPFTVESVEPAGSFRIRLGATTAEREADIRSAVERVGSLEFRIRARRETEFARREERETAAGRAVLPPDLAWVPLRTRERTLDDILVLTPERALATELAELRTRGVAESAPEYAALRDRYEKTLRSEVFTGADLESMSVTTQGVAVCLAFEIVDDRKLDFRDFTKRHIGEQVAIVLDGRVESDPVIRSELPGRGIIEGGGAGFTPREAEILCSALSSGTLPGRLVFVSEERLGGEPPSKSGR